MLTEAEKIRLLTDFYVWSGGFKPNECSPEEIQSFVKYAIHLDFAGRETEVQDFLAGTEA